MSSNYQDICYGTLTILSTNTENGKETFQLIIRKGCSKKSEFTANIEQANQTSDSSNSLAMSQKNELCYQTNLVYDEWNADGKKYDKLEGIFFRMSSNYQGILLKSVIMVTFT